MLRNLFMYGGMLLLAGAAVLATPSPGLAHGGGHGGGDGGGHFGGAHLGGYHGGYYHGGYHYGYPHAYYGYHSYHPYYGYRRYYPYYGLYGAPYSYPYDDAYGYVGSSPGYASGYYGAGGAETPAYSSSTTVTDQPDPIAFVTVKVPDGAEVWFDDTLTTSTGTTREYQSPPLTPGESYTYKVRARWGEKGHEVTQTQQVKVTAGAHVSVTFPIPAGSAEQTAAKRG